MGVEKQIRDMVDKPTHSKKKAAETEAREFAEEVLQLLRESEGKIVQGATKNDAERLAAIFSFIRGQVTECVVQALDYPATHRPDDPRQRLALEAGQMLYDIVHQQRHPVHKFFKGLLSDAMSPRQAPRREIYRRSLLMACARALEIANKEQGWNRMRAIREMRKNPVIAEHVPSEQWLTNLISQQADCTDPDYKSVIVDLLGRMKAARAEITESIIVWTAGNLQFSQAPLDMEAATRIEHRGSVLIPRDGGPPLFQLPKGGAIPVVTRPHEGDENIRLSYFHPEGPQGGATASSRPEDQS